jgi:HD-like signal output (HDOD) protein
MFLSKPCDRELLKRVVSRACHLSIILNSDELRSAAGRVAMLPAAPKTYIALNEALTRPSCSVADLAHVIERDVGLCAKILQLVNSAFFGLPRKIGSLNEAIAYIGIQTIRDLVLALEAFAKSSGPGALSQAELLKLQEHSLLAGVIARRINAGDKDKAEQAFLAGVLHEVGWLVPVPPPPADRSAPSVDRALLGAYMLGLWGLPHPIMEAMAYHHEPRLLAHSELELVDAVYIAHSLALEAAGSPSTQELDLDYLASLGVTKGHLDELREHARTRNAPSP